MSIDWVTVREHSRLTTSSITSSLDRAQISQSAFDWLCQLQSSFGGHGARLVEVEDRRWLRLDNHVGVIQTPCGTCLEILPKHFDDQSNVERSRALLCKMISSALDLPTREAGDASLQLFRSPLTEWVMRQFLVALDRLFKRGLRFEYQRVEEEQTFLRGQLDMTKQMRQLPGRMHLFHQRYDLFLPDRPENRLLRLALDRICKSVQEADNWRLAHELRDVMQPIPPSQQVQLDFSCWQRDRLMAHYQPIRPWCELILGEQMPLAVKGQWHGISLLFPMEKLFEQHVANVLKTKLQPRAQLRCQVASRYLCNHGGHGIFQLKPDLLLQNDGQSWILDTKWKRINERDRDNKYGLNQSDFYQMLAYGQQYLENAGDMMLIYPKTKDFTSPLRVFEFSQKLKLLVCPFDLEHDELITSSEMPLPLRDLNITIDAV